VGLVRGIRLDDIDDRLWRFRMDPGVLQLASCPSSLPAAVIPAFAQGDAGSASSRLVYMAYAAFSDSDEGDSNCLLAAE